MRDKLNLFGTKTANNLAEAFAGETQAKTRYEYYAEIAQKENLNSVAKVFLNTANQERGHAEIFYEYLTDSLEDTILTPKVMVPVQMRTTADNLLAAAKGENGEATKLYVMFSDEAKAEGFNDIAESFARIATIEKRHEITFLNLLERLKKNMLYKLPYEVTWQCTNCGLIINGKEAPEICPACRHEQNYFEVFCDNIVKQPYMKNMNI